MTTFDIEALLAEISPDAPCGEDISYDADFMELERLAAGTAETQVGDHIQEGEGPDWKKVFTLSLSLLERSRDLRVILYLTASTLRLTGLPGFCDGLALLQGIVERHWEHFFPQLDPDDDNDPLERMNILSSLSPPATMMSDQDPVKILPGLMEVPLCAPKDARLPQPTLRHILVATGELSIPEGQAGGLPTMQLIEAAFEQAEIDGLQATDRLLKACLTHLSALDEQLTDRVGATVAPNFDRLKHLLQQMQSKTGMFLENRGYRSAESSPSQEESDADGQAAEQASPASAFSKALSGQITSDQDVLKALDMIVAYYEKNEPSSPVPLVIKRARRLVGRSFVDIIRDLSPDAMSQVQLVSGEENSPGE